MSTLEDAYSRDEGRARARKFLPRANLQLSMNTTQILVNPLYFGITMGAFREWWLILKGDDEFVRRIIAEDVCAVRPVLTLREIIC